MDRNTNTEPESGNHGTVISTRHPGGIASHPDMIRLKELVGLLGEDRREILNAYLDDQDDQTEQHESEGGHHEQKENE